MEILPEATRSKLRSTTILTSLPQVIVELVQNSLDANASIIEIGLNADDWSCWVKDDGAGISREGLDLLSQGLEGRRYVTSKAYSFSSLSRVSTFGFRGEALASMADLTCLEITSRTANSRESWSVILKGPQCLYNGPSVRWARNTPGTVVHVRDAFYSLPIRRVSHPSSSRTAELVRKDIATLALVSPSVTFIIDDLSKTTTGQTDRSRVLSVPRTSSMLTTFRQVHGRNLAEHVEELDETSNGIRIQGFISLDGALSKAHQYLFLNRHPLAWCDLHRAVEIAFNNSSFARHALEGVGEAGVFTERTRRSPRKAEKRPVYVLSITLSRADVDNCIDPAKALVHLRDRDALCGALTALVQGFLFRNDFAGSAQLQDASSPSPRKRRRVQVQPDEGTLPVLPLPRRKPPPIDMVEFVFDPRNPEEGEVVWVDPQTNVSYAIDMATGNSYPADRGRAARAQQNTVDDSPAQLPRQRRTLGVVGAPRPQQNSTPEWIRRALDANQVFPPTERQIRQDSLSAPAARRNRRALPNTSPVPALRGMTPAALQEAHVVDQVDHKFVACVLGRTLVLVDQHAADERVRVERLFAEPCRAFLRGAGAGLARRLDPPKPVLLSASEAQQLARSSAIQDAFRRWGVTFSDAGGSTHGSAHQQVHVESVPEVVADKLMTGDELRDLVRTYLAEIEEAEGAFSLPPVDTDEKRDVVWQKALRWCPKALVNLINSRACRGAIMFNDPLDHAQCERLVRNLAETALPLQCAHGRPSTVPIYELDSRPSGRRRAAPVAWSLFTHDARRC